MLNLLNEDSKNYVLLYKKGSEASDCSYNSIVNTINNISELNIMAADVGNVRDIHEIYDIASAPSLLIFEGKVTPNRPRISKSGFLVTIRKTEETVFIPGAVPMT